MPWGGCLFSPTGYSHPCRSSDRFGQHKVSLVMRGSVKILTLLPWVLACVLLSAVPPLKAAGQQPQTTETDKTREDAADAPVGISMTEALQMAVHSAEALETADADERNELVERVTSLMRTIHDADPANPWLDYLAAYVHIANGRNGDAIESIESFLNTREGRNYWRAHRLHGDLLVGRYPRLALASYKRAEALKADDPSVLFGLARCYANQGETGTAIEYVTNAIVADTNETISYTNFLAQLFLKEKQWSQALRTAQQAVAMAERKVEQGGDVRATLQRVDTQLALAIDAASALIRAEQENEEAYLTAVRLQRKRSDNAYRAAKIDELRTVERGVEVLKENASAKLLEAYAVLLAETGRTEDAIAAFERLLDKDPANVAASDWLAKLRASAVDDKPATDHASP